MHYLPLESILPTMSHVGSDFMHMEIIVTHNNVLLCAAIQLPGSTTVQPRFNAPVEA